MALTNADAGQFAERLVANRRHPPAVEERAGGPFGEERGEGRHRDRDDVGRRLPRVVRRRDGDLVRATLTQVPLKLAWALTVHKSQGMTLDAASVDLSDAFVDGIGYVGISRVRNLDHLELAGLSPDALRVSPAAVDFEQDVLERADNDPIPAEPTEPPAPPEPAAEPGFAQSSLFA